MRRIILGLFIISTIIFITGCGNSSRGNNSNAAYASVQAAINAPKSNLTQKLKDSLTYMYSEESLAHDVYLDIYNKQKAIQLYTIATRAETQHISAVNQLAQKYNLNMGQYPDTDIPYGTNGVSRGKYPIQKIQDLYNMLYDKGIQSQKDALEVGCMVEVTDIDDLNIYIRYAQESKASDIESIFKFLRNGSYNHYWAFNNGLKNLGISDGCCSLGAKYCHNEYPKHSNGNGGGRGNGRRGR